MLKKKRNYLYKHVFYTKSLTHFRVCMPFVADKSLNSEANQPGSFNIDEHCKFYTLA